MFPRGTKQVNNVIFHIIDSLPFLLKRGASLYVYLKTLKRTENYWATVIIIIVLVLPKLSLRNFFKLS